MKTFRTIGTTLLWIVVCGLVAACSSDDDNGNGSWNENGNGKGSVQSKRLARLEITCSYMNQYITYSYDANGFMSNIHTMTNGVSENISFIITESSVAWNIVDSNGDSAVFKAVINNGRAQSMTMTMNDCIFRYDVNGQLIEVEKQNNYWERIYKLTWNNGNITRLEERTTEGILVYSIDYTYTNYVADNVLAYEFLFNPLTEHDFLDTVYQRALFYTGTCGKLSKNLPATATFYSSINGDDFVLYGERTYEYKTSGEQITSVIIDGYWNSSKHINDYPYMLTLTWD